ncbi:unnamed protein product [Caenorhabditis auriculariae]|uniref:Potassium channel domain-containing protein n=1 Tax=Caenorhabditis auriculariae TaxID=2777116 RepID=A0A8S1H180_9PELO|nr:unnamed protein product [Caenorhabditis auriculariae]
MRGAFPSSLATVHTCAAVHVDAARLSRSSKGMPKSKIVRYVPQGERVMKYERCLENVRRDLKKRKLLDSLPKTRRSRTSLHRKSLEPQPLPSREYVPPLQDDDNIERRACQYEDFKSFRGTVPSSVRYVQVDDNVDKKDYEYEDFKFSQTVSSSGGKVEQRASKVVFDSDRAMSQYPDYVELQATEEDSELSVAAYVPTGFSPESYLERTLRQIKPQIGKKNYALFSQPLEDLVSSGVPLSEHAGLGSLAPAVSSDKQPQRAKTFTELLMSTHPGYIAIRGKKLPPLENPFPHVKSYGPNEDPFSEIDPGCQRKDYSRLLNALISMNMDVDDFDMGSAESTPSSLNEIPMEMDLTASGPPISDDETELEMRERKYITYAKRILPHVGLVLLLFVYLLVGATIFHAIEGPNELIQRDLELRTIFGLRRDFQDHIWNITQDVDNRISREAFNSINQEYFDQLDFCGPIQILSFFAATVITTIGYGNLVPTTTAGRVACIIFALFGIPLLLVTIADIGKFLSEFLSFLYRSYRAFKRKVIARRRSNVARTLRKHSKRMSNPYRSGSQSRASEMGDSKAGSLNLHDMETESEDSMEDELRIPSWEGLQYFEAFYFCFITMATVGFGDIVPTEQVYMFFTMAYIIFGLSLATMCIDLAGTEYIRKIHYLGSKMEDAKGAVMTGLQVGEHYLKHTGIEVIKTAGGKLVQVRGAVLNTKQARELGVEYIFGGFAVSPQKYFVRTFESHSGQILPDDITEKDGYIVQNKSYDRPALAERGYVRVNGNIIRRIMVPSKGGPPIIVPCLVLRESDI